MTTCPELLTIGLAEAAARRRGHPAIRLYTHVKMAENFLLSGRLGFVETARVTEKGFSTRLHGKIPGATRNGILKNRAESCITHQSVVKATILLYYASSYAMIRHEARWPRI